jgi:hypothetical protein
MIAVASPEGFEPDDRLGIALFRSGSWTVSEAVVGGKPIAGFQVPR